MKTRLTIRLRKDVLNRANEYARLHHISLSALIESYLENVTKTIVTTDELELTPLVKSLSGVIHLEENFLSDFNRNSEK
jgi:hypothetical protein